MTEKPKKSHKRLGFPYRLMEAKQVKTQISDKHYQLLEQEAREKEISKSELLRHIVYDYYQKKQQSQTKEKVTS